MKSSEGYKTSTQIGNFFIYPGYPWARALANDPGLLIVDEPTGNLDPKRSYELVGLLKEINRCGTTVVMITHEHDLVRYFGGRIINLDKGTITFDEMIGGSDYYEG